MADDDAVDATRRRKACCSSSLRFVVCGSGGLLDVFAVFDDVDDSGLSLVVDVELIEAFLLPAAVDEGGSETFPLSLRSTLLFWVLKTASKSNGCGFAAAAATRSKASNDKLPVGEIGSSGMVMLVENFTAEC